MASPRTYAEKLWSLRAEASPGPAPTPYQSGSNHFRGRLGSWGSRTSKSRRTARLRSSYPPTPPLAPTTWRQPSTSGREATLAATRRGCHTSRTQHKEGETCRGAGVSRPVLSLWYEPTSGNFFFFLRCRPGAQTDMRHPGCIPSRGRESSRLKIGWLKHLRGIGTGHDGISRGCGRDRATSRGAPVPAIRDRNARCGVEVDPNERISVPRHGVTQVCGRGSVRDVNSVGWHCDSS